MHTMDLLLFWLWGAFMLEQNIVQMVKIAIPDNEKCFNTKESLAFNNAQVKVQKYNQKSMQNGHFKSVYIAGQGGAHVYNLMYSGVGIYPRGCKIKCKKILSKYWIVLPLQSPSSYSNQTV